MIRSSSLSTRSCAYPLRSAGWLGILLALWASPSGSQVLQEEFVAREFTGAKGERLPYRLFAPGTQEGAALPLIIYLHDGTGEGTDNVSQIAGSNAPLSRLWVSQDIQSRHPAFVIAPQAPMGMLWSASDSPDPSQYASLMLDLVASIAWEFPIDASRIYLIGQSRGGRGAWDLVAKRPDLFAAVVPMAGEGDPARVTAARHVPIWAFHGSRDDTVPPSGSRDPVARLKAVGAPVKYTEYAGMGHDVWLGAVREPEFPEWLFTQRKTGTR